MNSRLKRKIANWFNITIKDLEKEYPESAAKKTGEARSVTFELDLLIKTYATVTEWPNGEGFDISWDTVTRSSPEVLDSKHISLHTTELECMLHGLNDLNIFE